MDIHKTDLSPCLNQAQKSMTFHGTRHHCLLRRLPVLLLRPTPGDNRITKSVIEATNIQKAYSNHQKSSHISIIFQQNSRFCPHQKNQEDMKIDLKFKSPPPIPSHPIHAFVADLFHHTIAAAGATPRAILEDGMQLPRRARRWHCGADANRLVQRWSCEVAGNLQETHGFYGFVMVFTYEKKGKSGKKVLKISSWIRNVRYVSSIFGDDFLNPNHHLWHRGPHNLPENHCGKVFIYG